MKKFIPIILTSVIIDIVIIAIVKYSNNVPSDEVPFWDNVASGIFCMGIIANIILLILYRKNLFKNFGLAMGSIATVVAGTLFPFIYIYFTSVRPTAETVLISEDYYYPHNEVHKTEHWEYSWGWGDLKYVNKKFVCVSAEFALSGEKAISKKTAYGFTLKKMETH